MKIVWLVLTAALLSACAPQVLVQQDPAANLPGTGTYRWDESSAGKLPGQQDPRVDNDIIQGMLKTAMDQGLARRGYHADGSTSAWLVSVSIGLQKRTEVFTEPAVPPTQVLCGMQGCFVVPWFDAYTTSTFQVDENTIMVDLRDATTHKLAWRGIITREINLNRDLQADRLQKTINALLDKLPGTTGAEHQVQASSAH